MIKKYYFNFKLWPNYTLKSYVEIRLFYYLIFNLKCMAVNYVLVCRLAICITECLYVCKSLHFSSNLIRLYKSTLHC